MKYAAYDRLAGLILNIHLLSTRGCWFLGTTSLNIIVFTLPLVNHPKFPVNSAITKFHQSKLSLQLKKIKENDYDKTD